jgi:hypothetical protein
LKSWSNTVELRVSGMDAPFNCSSEVVILSLG